MNHRLLGLLLVAVIGWGQPCFGQAPAGGAESITSAPPAKGKPWEPAWGFWPKFPADWQTTHQGLVGRIKNGPVKILFIGDSLTKGWMDGGKAVWDKNYAPLDAVDIGIGGDSTRQILWRIDHGAVDGISPKLIVLMIGTNNLYGDYNAGTNSEIAKGIETIIQQLKMKCPEARILLLGLLPRQNAYFSGRTKAINAQLAKLDGGSVRFLDMSDKFQISEGNLVADLYTPDLVHLQPKGYEVWAETMKPLFDEMAK